METIVFSGVAMCGIQGLYPSSTWVLDSQQSEEVMVLQLDAFKFFLRLTTAVFTINCLINTKCTKYLTIYRILLNNFHNYNEICHTGIISHSGYPVYEKIGFNNVTAYVVTTKTFFLKFLCMKFMVQYTYYNIILVTGRRMPPTMYDRIHSSSQFIRLPLIIPNMFLYV